jgi:hypothetical protein
MEHNLRVFISYSRKDIKLVEKLVSNLEHEGIMVLWTKKLATGSGFPEQLKVFIEHAHVFIPVITKSSSTRGWVHQEIGYAMALHIPVFPVLIGKVKPVGMIESIQAVKLNDDERVRRKQLNYNILSALLKKESMPALYQRAAVVEERAALMKQYSDKISSMDKFGIVRQKGGLSSFHIPDKHIGHQVWTDRYSPEMRSEKHKELQLGERKSLQQHANKEGCKLIINPLYALEGRSTLAARTRIQTMIDFLEAMPNKKLIVAIQKKKTSIESLTMVGDWFLAESVSFKDGDGFTNTFFTRNASEITKRIETFDEELDDLLEQLGWTKKNSREKAIEKLNRMMLMIKE